MSAFRVDGFFFWCDSGWCPSKYPSNLTQKQYIRLYQERYLKKTTASAMTALGNLRKSCYTGGNRRFPFQQGLPWLIWKWHDWTNSYGDNTLEMRSRPLFRQEIAEASVRALRYYTNRGKRKIWTYLNIFLHHSPFKRAKRSFSPPIPLIQLFISKVCHYPLYFIRTNMPLNCRTYNFILSTIKREKYIK